MDSAPPLPQSDKRPAHRCGQLLDCVNGYQQNEEGIGEVQEKLRKETWDHAARRNEGVSGTQGQEARYDLKEDKGSRNKSAETRAQEHRARKGRLRSQRFGIAFRNDVWRSAGFA